MPDVTGLLETSLYVDDLDRSSAFYKDLFGFQLIVTDARMRAFAVAGKHVLLLFRKGASLVPGNLPPHDGDGQLHLAFAISADSVDEWEHHLSDRGIPVESRITWDRGGKSIYFRDPDGHLLELVTPGCWPTI